MLTEVRSGDPLAVPAYINRTVVPNLRGAWVTATVYFPYDQVTNGGSSYLCYVGHTSSATTQPGVGATWATVWMLVAAKGADGTNGTNGADGALPPASDAETIAGVITNKVVTPHGDKAALDARVAPLETVSKWLPSLPSVVNHFYPCTEGRGVILRDPIAGADIDFSATGAGTKAWTNDGALKMTAGWFKTPSFTARAMFFVVRTAEGSTAEYIVSSPTGKAINANNIGASTSISKFRTLSGWGISEPVRRASNGTVTAHSINSGAWGLHMASLPADETGLFLIGAASQAGSGAAGSFELMGFGYCSADPTDAECRQILNHLRERSRAQGVFLAPQDCPQQRVLMVIAGESTGEGTKLLTALTTNERLTFAESCFVKAYNGTTPGATGRRFRRLSFRTTNANNNPPSNATKFGMEWGVNNFRNADIDDGRPLDILKVAQGSTYLTPAGEDGSTNTLVFSTFTGSVSGTVMTVSAVATGVIAVGQHLTSTATVATFTASIAGTVMTVSAVSAGTISVGASVRGAGLNPSTAILTLGTGAGGTGTYNLNVSQTIASEAMTTEINYGSTITTLGTGTGGTGTYNINVAQTFPSNAIQGDKGIGPSVSRNALPGGGTPSNPTGQLFFTLEAHNVIVAEALARGYGIGYSTLILVEPEGLNDAYLGDTIITSAALYQGWLQDRHNMRTLVYGLAAVSVRTVVIKPHLPSGGLGGGDPDYPNNSIGTSRLNALNFIRTACDNFNTANTNISILDGGSYALDTPTDYVHPSVAGYDAMGQAVAALVNYEARITPRA